MNDLEIRSAYHRRRLARQHRDPDTLVVDELGLRHGACRADIAIVNGHLVGVEIKSDADSLERLDAQIEGYSSVFDRAVLVTTHKHLEQAIVRVPEWWGVVRAELGPRGGVDFITVRRTMPNPGVDLYSVAQLLWRTEAAEILSGLGAKPHLLRHCRAVLYEQLVSQLTPRELRRRVRDTMKSRSSWRDPGLPSSSAYSSRPSARLWDCQ